MKVFHRKSPLSEHLRQLKSETKSIGFVPTMGALHLGHKSLFDRALRENEVLVISIFVNPTQFDNQEDLKKYPRTLDKDLNLIEKIRGQIIVYAPSAEDIYDGEPSIKSYHFGGLENKMEGQFRIGHFDGVANIVQRLIEVINPERAYFGEKDYQQLEIVKRMVAEKGIDVEIIGVPIYRDVDGLAMSSRNTRLTLEHREAAPFIYKVLNETRQNFGTKSAKELTEWAEDQFLKHPLLTLEYFVIADTQTLEKVEVFHPNQKYRAFVAVYAGEVRLIDNIALN